MKKYVFLMFISAFFLTSCSETVEKFDKRLTKKYKKKGFKANVLEENGHSIFYHDNNKKDAPTIVFIHGFGGDGKISWADQAKAFKEEYRVIIPDLLWFGSSISTKTPTLKTQTEAIHTLLKALHISDAHIVGISYGGFVAIDYAHTYADNLKSLTIVNSPGAVVEDAEIDKFCKQVGVSDVKEAFIPKTGEDVKRLLEFSFYHPPKIPDFLMDQVLEQYFSKHPLEQAELLDDLPTNRDRLHGPVKAPTKIIWGMEDQVFHVYDGYTLKWEMIADLTVISHAGHALPGEKPSSFNEVLLAFLKRNNK